MTTSAAGGAFEFAGVPGGKYTMTASKTGRLSAAKDIVVNHDIEVDTTATIYMAKKGTDKEWVAVLYWEKQEEEGSPDSWTKWAGQNVYYGNPTSIFAGTSVSMGKGGAQILGDAGASSEVTAFNLESGCEWSGNEFCDVKFMVNEQAPDDLKNAKAKVSLYQGTKLVKEFKIEDCGGSVDDGWWHVFVLDASSNKLKWNCREGGASFIQETPGHFSKEFTGEMVVDFESYVGAFPGRFWRHSRKHSRKKIALLNSSSTSSFLQSQKGAETVPKMLKVGASDVDVKPPPASLRPTAP